MFKGLSLNRSYNGLRSINRGDLTRKLCTISQMHLNDFKWTFGIIFNQFGFQSLVTSFGDVVLWPIFTIVTHPKRTSWYTPLGTPVELTGIEFIKSRSTHHHRRRRSLFWPSIQAADPYLISLRAALLFSFRRVLKGSNNTTKRNHIFLFSEMRFAKP